MRPADARSDHAAGPTPEPVLRLVQVVPHWKLGGMQEIARLLDAGLPRHGIDSTVVALDAVTGPYVIGLATGWASLVRRWRHDRPDVVLAHTAKNAAYSLSAAAAAGVGRRLVVVHGSRESLGEPKTRLLEAMCRTGLATDVVHVGHASAASYAAVHPAVHRRETVVRNGTRLPEGAAAPCSQAAARVVYCGRLDAGKNVVTVLDAMAGTGVGLDVVGDGPDRAELEEHARSLGVDVHFHGAVPRSELTRHYAHAALFVFPTLAEGLPLVLVEVAAVGLPVVASDLPNNREVLGEAALYCPPSDVAAWRAAITDVLSDPARRAAMARAAQERVELFDVESMVRGYAALLVDAHPVDA